MQIQINIDITIVLIAIVQLIRVIIIIHEEKKALTTPHKGFSALAISKVTTISSSLFCICIITRKMLNINLPIYTCILKKF